MRLPEQALHIVKVSTMNNAITDTLSDGMHAGHEYLIFTLGNEEYGIDILKVQEIRHYEQATRIPNAPDFVSGVTNLRGAIVPVVDLRVKFQLGSKEINDHTVVIILNLHQRVIGMVVDAVADVVPLATENIKPAPDFTSTLSTRYLQGLGLLNERMLILIDIEKLMNSEEMELVDQLTQTVNQPLAAS